MGKESRGPINQFLSVGFAHRISTNGISHLLAILLSSLTQF